MIWRAIRWLFGALFLISAALQLNDPDPLPWIGIYLLATVATVAPDARRDSLAARAVVALVSLGWAAYLWTILDTGVTIMELFEPMETRGGAVEIGREMGGLLIMGLWSLAIAVVSWRRLARASS